ncbi:MAG: CRTAC1 family protein [Candidatus Acidiferrales bacterium]
MKLDRRTFVSELLAASVAQYLPPGRALAALFAQPQPRPQQQPANSQTQKPFSRFTDVAAQAGLTAPMIYGGFQSDTYIIESMGGGCAFFDFDNDGWMDIFILGGTRLAGPPAGASNRLYKNNRDGTFTDVTEKSGLHDVGWANGVCVGDYNNDGHEDLFCTYFGHNKLYRNNGDGTFTDVTKSAGLFGASPRFGTGCSFLDYNRDGWLDLFVANYVEFDLANAPKPSATSPTCSYEGVAVYCGPRGMVAPAHSLYRNNGDGTFTDVSKSSGIEAVKTSYGLTAACADFDEDGWPDIFVACDSTPSLLFMNNRDGTFSEQGLMRGVAVSAEGSEYAGMGVGVGDYSLDGHLDIFKTHFQRQPSGLYHNSGKAEFDDVTVKTAINNENRYVSWGAGIVDLDNDGYPDLFLVTGNVYPELEKVFPQLPYSSPRIIFRNLGNGRFAELIDDAGPGIAARHPSRGCAFGDFDNDGDLDIVIMNVNQPPSLLRNDAPPQNHWLKIKLIGTKSNRSAIGARVLLRYVKKIQAQALLSQSSYISSNDPRLHFGLGDDTAADIEVRWPNGLEESFKNVAADRLVVIQEGAGIISAKALGGSGQK